MTIERMKELGVTLGPCKVRELIRDGELQDCFVEAPSAQGNPYASEILGDDEYGEDVARKKADCALIADAFNTLMESGYTPSELWAEFQKVRALLEDDSEEYLGWDCEQSPTKHCEYAEDDIARDFCLHCGNPEERK